MTPCCWSKDTRPAHNRRCGAWRTTWLRERSESSGGAGSERFCDPRKARNWFSRAEHSHEDASFFFRERVCRVRAAVSHAFSRGIRGEMERLFADQYEEARTAGRLSVASLWFRTFRDLVLSLMREHVEEWT